MRIGLVGYFDIGASYGLADDVFPPEERAPEPDIGLVGLDFPLGQGLVVDLATGPGDEVRFWREEAARQVRRPEMETGWSASLGVARDTFDAELEALAAAHPLAKCELRVHAIGTVYAELHFARGVPARSVHGLLACFEFAAYTPAVADALLAAAELRVRDALGPGLTGLAELSRRMLPEVKADATGYRERMLFRTGLTRLLAAVDEGDDAEYAPLIERTRAASTPVPFEYHGTLHYDWALCLLEPNELAGWDDAAGEGESPTEQIMRMEACIRIAHVFLGACDAFTRLFETEMHEQVGGYVAKTAAGRGPEELNRLRTLALAVVSLTSFSRVTPSEEDQAYFVKFDENADITGKHRAIQQATEVLYNVQVAETQSLESRRQWVLSVVVGLLTSLTLISVTADAYDFVRAEEPLIEQRGYRLAVLAIEVALILAVLAFLAAIALRRTRR